MKTMIVHFSPIQSRTMARLNLEMCEGELFINGTGVTLPFDNLSHPYLVHAHIKNDVQVLTVLLPYSADGIEEGFEPAPVTVDEDGIIAVPLPTPRLSADLI